MTEPTTDRPTDTIRDAFEAILHLLACLLGTVRTSHEPTAAEMIGAMGACEVNLDGYYEDTHAGLDALRDLIQRAAEEHNRRAAAGGDWTPERIREARERCERATPGPWEASYAYNNGGMPTGDFKIPGHNGGATVEMLVDDAYFCAHARKDLPAALDEIERRAAELADARAETATARRERDDFAEARDAVERLCAAELAACAPADASLEGRAKAALSAFDACPVWADDSFTGDEKELRAMIDAVRVADASRPGHPIEPLAREAGTMSPDWIRGVRAAADVAASYNRDSTHPYRLDDCILAKLNVGGEPRANEHASRPDLTDAGEAPIQIEPPPDAYHERDRADRLQAMLQACEVDLVTARAQLQQTERAAGAHVATIEALREQIAAAHRAAHAIGPDEQIPGVAAATPYAIWSAEYDAAEAARVLAPLAGKLTPDVCDACRRSTFDGQRTGEAEAVLLCGRCRATAEREEAARDAVTEIEPPPPTRPSSATRTT